MSTPPTALVDFVLNHLTVEGSQGSRQHLNDGSFACHRRTLDSTNLIFVTRGRIRWTIDQTPHTLAPGSLLLSPPGIPHRGETITQRVTLLSMHLNPTLPGGQDAFDLLHPPTVQIVQTQTRLHQYLDAALQEYDRPNPPITRRCLSHFANLITLELLRHDADQGLLAPRPFDPLVAEMLGQLDQRLHTPTTLADLAEISGYTAQHLNRLFQKTLGVTPLQHLTHLRMQHAADLLISTDQTLAQIAQQITLDDPYYFSRLFKQHLGQSPAAYRAASDSYSPS